MTNIFIFFALLPSLFSTKTVVQENKAHISIEQNTVKLGEVYPGQTYVHKFIIKNSGSLPLIISDIEASCGCTVVKYSKEPILPGKEGEITVDYIPRSDTFGFTSKSFTITSNADNNPEYLHLQATVVKKDKKNKKK